jgi:hypothetical protein
MQGENTLTARITFGGWRELKMWLHVIQLNTVAGYLQSGNLESSTGVQAIIHAGLRVGGFSFSGPARGGKWGPSSTS